MTFAPASLLRNCNRLDFLETKSGLKKRCPIHNLASALMLVFLFGVISQLFLVLAFGMCLGVLGGIVYWDDQPIFPLHPPRALGHQLNGAL